MDLELSGKSVVVTGAGRGHGQSMALALAREGAAVAVADINGENARQVQMQIEQLGGKAVAFKVDVTNMSAVAEMMHGVQEKFGRIDVLVNNACASIRRVPFLEMSTQEWDQVIAVNLRGSFNCTQAAGRLMQAQGGGRIISISSFAAGLPAAGFAAYSASKAALEALSDTVAGELGKHGVTAVTVRPGVVETDFTRPGHAGEVGEKMRSVIALGRFGETEELARVICFLASPLSQYINGGPVPVDGGKYVCQF